jgi:hypothetical protein
MVEVTGETAGYGGAGLIVLGILGRWGLSWLKDRGLTDAKTDANKDVIETLREEALRWRGLYDKEFSNHEATTALLTEMRIQNRLLRGLLMQQGMSQEAIDALVKGDI